MRFKDDVEAISKDISSLLTRKNLAYGNSASKSSEILKILYPSGIGPQNLDDALIIVRVLDKLSRIATDNDEFGESPWTDIAGYAILRLQQKGLKQFNQPGEG